MMTPWSLQQVREKMENTFRKPSEVLHAAVRDRDFGRLQLLLSEEDIQNLLIQKNHAWGTPLHVAVWCSDFQAVQHLLTAGADALLEWDQNDSEVSAIQLAAGRGHLHILSALWDATAHRTHANGHGSCLINASAQGQVEIVRWLLAIWDGWSAEVTRRALAAAVHQWHAQVVEVLLQHVNYEEAFRYDMLVKACSLKPMPARMGTPEYEKDDQDNQHPLLHIAASNVALGGALRGLLDSGADPNSQDGNGQIVMHKLASPQPKERTRRWTAFPSEHLLTPLDHGGSVSIGDENGESPLHLASFFLPCDIVRKWLGYRQETQYKAFVQLNNHGESLLHYAAAGGNILLLHHLLRLQADASTFTKETIHNDSEMLTLIREKGGPDANAVSRNGWTSFLCALTRTARAPSERVLFSRLKVIEKSGADALRAARLLLSVGAEPGAVSSQGWTPLHSLAGYDYPDDSAADAVVLAEELITRGADVNARAFAFFYGWEEMHRGVPWQWHLPWGFRVPKLMAEFPGAARGGVTPLHWAAENGCTCIAKVLLAHGADPLAEDEKGSTPETTAKYSMRYKTSPKIREEMIKLLKQAGKAVLANMNRN